MSSLRRSRLPSFAQMLAEDPTEVPRTVLGVTYHLVAGDLFASLRELGVRVVEVPPLALEAASFADLVRSSGATAIVGVNFSPEVAWLASRAAVPYVSWTIDPLPARRLRLVPGTDPAQVTAFVHRRSLVEALREAGLPRVAWLPLAAASERRAPVQPDDVNLVPYRCGASFVGTSLVDTAQGLAEAVLRLGKEPLRRRVDTWLHRLAHGDVERGWTGFVATGTPLPAWLQSTIPDADTERNLRELLDGQLSYLLRFERVGALVRAPIRGGVAVWGDGGLRLSAGKAWRGAADNGETLTRVFNASTVNVDLPRVHQRDLLTMRVYDVLSCGALALVESAATVDGPFVDGVHLVKYADTRELVDRATYYAAHPDEATRIGLQGRRAVLENHTMRHRARLLADAVQRAPA